MDAMQLTKRALNGSIERGRSLDKWDDWKWQVSHCIRQIASVERLLDVELEAPERRMLEETVERFPMSISPYYFSLIHPDQFRDDPVFRQSVPLLAELDHTRHDLADPLHEDADSPVPGITHRYPDRVLFHISNVCAMYCRHCTRKRRVGDRDRIPSRDELELGIRYIEETPVIRDVLLSGGDPFMLPDSMIDWLLGRLRSIPHVEIVRIGTRTPVVLPQRITSELVEILARHHPLWVNTMGVHLAM